MMLAPNYISVGFGNALCSSRILAVLVPNAAATKRRMKRAKEEDTFLDLSFGRSIKSVLLLDTG